MNLTSKNVISGICMAHAQPKMRQLSDTKEDRKIFRYFDKKLGDWEKTLDSTLVKSEPIIYNNISKVLGSAECRVLVAYIGAKPVGYIVGKIKKSEKCYGSKKYGYIECLYVEEEFRNQGWASQLFSLLDTWFVSKKIKEIELRVFANNAKAIECYERWGFKIKSVKMVLEK